MALSQNGREEAVTVLKASANLSGPTRQQLREGLILGVIAAEAQEMGFAESLWEGVGGEIRAGGLGLGQIYENAHNDVLSKLSTELHTYMNLVNAWLTADQKSLISISTKWQQNVKNDYFSSFFILGYLAICIDRAQKPGRPASDTLKYGIVYFHGARPKVLAIQKKIAPNKVTSDEAISWADVEQYIIRSGNSDEKKLLIYVDTVLNGGGSQK